MAFLAQVRTTPPFAVARFHGDLDMDSESQVVEVVERALEQGCTVVTVDLADVGFLDCCALGTLIAAVHRLHAAHGELFVTEASPAAQRLLDLTGTGWLTGADSVALAQ